MNQLFFNSIVKTSNNELNANKDGRRMNNFDLDHTMALNHREIERNYAFLQITIL